MKTLDERLYDWIGERDEARFERQFASYYRLAFPATLRYLSRVSRWGRHDLEELAQEALIRFFDHIGTERRQAGEEVSQSLTHLTPLPLPHPHPDETCRWKEAVHHFHHRAFSFHPATFNRIERLWRAEIQDVRDLIAPLQQGGKHLALKLESLDPDAIVGALRVAHSHSEGTPCAAIRAFISLLDCIIPRLPRLQIPTNSYLFESASTIYLDERRKRARLKRREPIFSPAPHPAEAGAARHIAEPTLVPCWSDADASDLSLERLEDREELEQFHAYLCRPVEALADRVEDAETPKAARQARRRWQAESSKLTRAFSILSLMGQGFTQEEVAARLGLTRNKVKYVIGKVQADYKLFLELNRPERAFSQGRRE